MTRDYIPYSSSYFAYKSKAQNPMSFSHVSTKLQYFHLCINGSINVNAHAGPVQSSLMQPSQSSFSSRACRSIAVLLCGFACTASAATAEVSCSEGHTETVTSRGTAYSSFCAAVVRRVVQDVQFGVEFVKRRRVTRACVRGAGCRSTTRQEDFKSNPC